MASDQPLNGRDFDRGDDSERGRSQARNGAGEDDPGEPDSNSDAKSDATMRDTPDAQERIDTLEDRVEQLTNELADASARIDALHRAREYLIDQVDDIDERVDDLEARRKAEERVNHLKNAVDGGDS